MYDIDTNSILCAFVFKNLYNYKNIKKYLITSLYLLKKKLYEDNKVHYCIYYLCKFNPRRNIMYKYFKAIYKILRYIC